ncbi:MAG: trypsin-like peptidase domain-containing protein [Ilumatobacter sp.]|nr:trypsin-like peptidase domain-containing protein [Ilumatobacter sp.]
MRRFLSLPVAALCVAGVACGAAQTTEIDPLRRAVEIETTACGHASRTRGSGVVVGDGRVLTAAHVVVGAGDVTVTHAGERRVAEIAVLDVTRDLAVLAVQGVALPVIETADAAAGERVAIVDGVSSGTIDAGVRRRVLIDIDDVRGADRHERDGYELDAEIGGGDSGAGVFDGDGRLVAIVFAEPTERDAITYAVGGRELALVLGAHDRRYECRPESSRVVELERSEAT